MYKKIGFLTAILFFSLLEVFSVRLFYLSTDRTFSENERKRIKIETDSYINSIKVRVYKINDPVSFFMTQEDVHRPRLKGRTFRYYTPEVAEGFSHFMRSNLRGWARSNIPAVNRKNIMETYPSFAMDYKETSYTPKKIVNIISDPNFSLIEETNYTIENRYNSWNYNYIFFNHLEKGTYLIEGISDYNVAYTVLNVSDYGFIVKKGNEDVLVYSVNNETGEAYPNVKVTVYNRFKKELTTITTGKDGLGTAKVKDSDLFMIGKSKDDAYTFYDPRYFPANIRDNYVYMYTERPVYKGNDEVSLKGVLRKYENDAYKLIANQAVKVEIIDPMGNVINLLDAETNSNGSFDSKFLLPEEAKAGRYLIVATIDEKKYEAEFKVEYYIKPEFQVAVKPQKKIYMAGEKVNARISAKYFYGDPVRNIETSYSVYRSRFTGEAWTKPQDKSFYLSQKEFIYSQMELIKTGNVQLNNQGMGELTFKTGHDDGAYNYFITVSASSDSGARISGSASVKVVEANIAFTIDADKFVFEVNEDIVIDCYAADYEGNPLQTDLMVRVDTEVAPGDVHLFYDDQVKTDKDGKAEIRFSADRSGFVRIVVSGLDVGGNEGSKEKFIWIGEHGAAYNYKGGRIKLALDKSHYRTGDTAKLLVISPVSDVDFLMTVEGDTVYDSKVNKMKSNSAMVNIPVKKNYLPNVFVDVSYIFQNKLYNNTIKLIIPPDEKFLNIEITSDKEIYAPGDTGKFTVKVTDINNKPVKDADISVGVVDEKIYAISKELAVDIRKYFYPIRRNNVMSFSSIGYRFYGYAMNANTELAAKFFKEPTGLAAFKEGEKERKTFKDTILWIPSLITDNKGMASFEAAFPDNITKWRITAVGVGPGTTVGKGTDSVITKMTFFCDISMPKIINEGDEITIYSSVYNYSKEDIEARLYASGTNIHIEGVNNEIFIPTQGVRTVQWTIKPEDLENCTVSIKAESKDKKYVDIITKEVKVIPHSIKQVANASKEVTKKDNSLSFDIPARMKQYGQKLTVTVSSSFAPVIMDALPYLITYPYGCVEQTTSSFLPNLAALEAFQEFDVMMPTLAQKLPENITRGLGRLYNYQQGNGAWGWFGGGEIDVFMTSYVLYALSLTKQLEYQVSEDVLTKGLDALESYIGQARHDVETTFALYVLSMNGRKIPSVMENLRPKNLSDYALSLYILAQSNYKNKDKAKEAYEILKKRAKDGPVKGTLYWGESDTNEWHHANIETTAWAVRAINSIEGKKSFITKIIGFFTRPEDVAKSGARYLILQRKGNRWLSTRDTAAAVFALSDVLKKTKVYTGESHDVTLNGEVIGTVDFSKDNFKSTLTPAYDDIAPYLTPGDTNTVEISGLGNDEVFASASFEYYSNTPTIKAQSNGYQVQRNYFKLSQFTDYYGSIKYRMGRKVTNVNKGDTFIVELDIKAGEENDYIFVEEYIPSGCMFIKDFLLYNVEGSDSGTYPNYTDFRDGRVIFFMDRAHNMKLYYVVKAIYPGEYKVLPATSSMMYFPDVSGNSSDDLFKIYDPH